MLLKLEKTLFYVFLFLIPFQIRIFLHNAGNEWNSVFLYAGDVIFVAILILWLMRQKSIFGGLTSYGRLNLIILILFLAIAFVSIFFSSATKISIFRWLKLLEFVLLYIYITSIFKSQFSIFKLLRVIFYSGVFQAILAIAQFIKQGSIGIKFIEAGIFLPNSPGVANFILNGERIMRSYGSFPHPNVLAAFLLLAIFAFYALWLKKPIGPIRIIGPIGLIGLIFALFLTFSRTAIAVFGVMSLIFFLIEFFKLRKIEHTEQRLADGKKLIKLFGLVFVSCILVIVILFPYIKARFFTISMEEQAIDLRFFYNKMAISMIKEKPLLGIGIGNFVNYSKNYPAYLRAASKMLGLTTVPDWIYQPVHNIYLLIAAEIGILGAIAFLLLIAKTLIRPIRLIGPIGFIVVGFLILALADHYFWTLQSGGIMFWLALGLAKSD